MVMWSLDVICVALYTQLWHRTAGLAEALGLTAFL